jgi:hypothetical protein
VPDAKFCGANVHEKPEWARNFAAEFGPSGRVAVITEHFYPGGSAYAKAAEGMMANDDVRARKPKDPAMGRDQMLSAEWLGKYQKLYEGFGPQVKSNGLPYRLEEANNFFHGGLQGASDSFASALWGLDFLHWWAAHDCDGINFHTGDVVAAGGQNTACRYATFLTAPGGYEVHPIGYAIKAFDFGSHGRRVPVTVSAVDKANVTAYGVVASDKTLFVTLINKDHGTNAHDITVTLAAGGSYAKGEQMVLAAPQYDTSLATGVTLGGSEIKNDASWKGKWTSLSKPAKKGQFTMTLPPATAAVVKLK